MKADRFFDGERARGAWGTSDPHFCHPAPSARITPLVDGLP